MCMHDNVRAVRDQFMTMRTQDKMEEVEWVDHWGRKFVVYVRIQGDVIGDPSKGVIKGPQPLDMLGLDQETNVRLHNELYARGIITYKDAMHRPMAILQAIQQALRVNVQQVQNAYAGIQPEPAAERTVASERTPQSEPAVVHSPGLRVTQPHTTPIETLAGPALPEPPIQPQTQPEEGVTDAR